MAAGPTFLMDGGVSETGRGSQLKVRGKGLVGVELKRKRGREEAGETKEGGRKEGGRCTRKRVRRWGRGFEAVDATGAHGNDHRSQQTLSTQLRLELASSGTFLIFLIHNKQANIF